MRKLRTALLLSLALAGLAGAAQATEAVQPLKLDIYNPGDKGIFPVASVLVEGAHDAVLIDAQFAKGDAQKLVEKIKASGRHLTTIYISHGDPDYYFGLDVLHAAFPDAKIVASKPAVEHIKASSQAKLAYWGPILKQDAPATLVTPDVLDGDKLTLEGRELDVIGLDGPTPDRSFVWIPSLKAVVGGVVVFGNLHVWMADTQTSASHTQWLATLKRIEQLKPGNLHGMDRSLAALQQRILVDGLLFLEGIHHHGKARNERAHGHALGGERDGQRPGHVGKPAGLDQREDFGRDRQNLHAPHIPILT